MTMNLGGGVGRLLVGCVIGFVVIVIWILTERVVSYPPAEAPAATADVDTTREYPVRPPPTGSLNDNPAQSEKKPEDPASEAIATPQLNEHAGSTPYERMMPFIPSVGVTMVLHERQKILTSEDDPQWARAMEKELFAFVINIADSDSTTVESITCRSAGCELQLSHDPGKTSERVLLGLRSGQFPSLRLALDVPHTVGGRRLQLTYLKRVKQEAN